MYKSESKSSTQKSQDKLVDTANSSGLFLWEPKILDRINKVKFGTPSLEDKQLKMVGYLIELCYELTLSPSHNVSISPGFERALGIFGGIRSNQ